MATFTSSPNVDDHFVGTDAAADIFLFHVGHLNARDRIVGGNGPAQDRLVFSDAGQIYAQLLTGVTGIERIELANGTNRLYLTDPLVSTAQNRSVTVIGNDGDDVVNGWFLSAANRVDIHAELGNDALIGGAGDDIFRFAASALNQYDSVSGRGGYDRLAFTTAGPIYSEFLAGVTGIEQIELANGTNRLYLTDQLVGTSQNRGVAVIGNNGDDVVNGWFLSAAHRVDIQAGLGNDTLVGGAGNDIFRFTASGLNQYDSVSGRGGYDRLVFTTAGQIYGQFLAGVTGIEQIELANGTNRLTLTGQMASTAEGRTVKVIGGSGDDSIGAFAFSAADHVDVASGGGNDSLLGGAGNDIFRFAASQLNQNDSVSGRGGYDRLVFTTAGQIYGQFLAGVTGIEQVELANGTNRLTLTGQMASTAEGRTVKVIGGSGDDSIGAFAFSAADHVDIASGSGNDSLLGGAGDDIFRFAAADLNQNDIVSGRGGYDRLVFTTAGQIYGQFLAGVTGIEQIELANGTNRLNLTAQMASTAQDHVVTVIGNDGNDLVNALLFSATDRVDIHAGLGNDTLVGGAGDDIFRFTAGALTSADRVEGHGGHDRIQFTTAGTISLTDWSSIRSIEEIAFANGTNTILLTGSPDLWWYGQLKLTLNDGNDSLDASNFNMAVRVEAGAGDDQLKGGFPDDSFLFRMEDFNAADLVYGGDSNWEINTLQFTTAGHLTDAQWNAGNKVQHIRLADGDNVVELSAKMASYPSGPITIFDGAGNDSITVTSGRLIAHLGTGNDSLTGGSDSDQFIFENNTLNGLDRIDGGGGADVITFLQNVNLTKADLVGVSSIESIEFMRGGSITVDDTLVEATSGRNIQLEFLLGAQVDASSLTAANGITVDSYEGATHLIGGDGADHFNFVERGEIYNPRSFIGDDVVVGGDGAAIDELWIYYGSTYDAAMLSSVSGIEQIYLRGYWYEVWDDSWGWSYFIDSSDYDVEITDALVSTAHAGHLLVQSDYGDDIINASSLSAPYSVTLRGDGGADHLTGGAGQDRLEGGDGFDTLTGGLGADIFAWSLASDGNDIITDFTHGEDQLEFTLDAFDINGGAFDRLVQQSGSGLTNINDADLLLFAGIVTDAADLRAQLTATTTGADVGEGLFVAARTSDGNTHIFYTGDASGTTDESIYDMADLGAVIAPSAITLGDFAFV